MDNMNSKNAVAVFTQRYLNLSMTFVYRQIISVQKQFELFVLTSNKIEHLEQYPFSPIFCREKTFTEKISRRVRKTMGRYALLSGAQEKYFSEVISDRNAKLIHAHFGPSGIEILPVAKRSDLPLLVTFHGYDASSLLNNSRYVNDLKGLFGYAHVIAVSDNMAQKLQNAGARPERINVIRYGIDIEKFPFFARTPISKKMQNKETIEFLQVSNFFEKKGHRYTLQAFARLLKKHANCRLTLAGGGDLKDEVIAFASELGISDKVYFPDKVMPSEVIEYMKKADVFVHHSVTAASGDQEGIPNVIIEAMATGLPVISTFHAGIPELVNNGKNGFLVKERDVEDYAVKMTTLVESDCNFASEARKTVEYDFNLLRQAEKLADVYNRIIEKTTARETK